MLIMHSHHVKPADALCTCKILCWLSKHGHMSRPFLPGSHSGLLCAVSCKFNAVTARAGRACGLLQAQEGRLQRMLTSGCGMRMQVVVLGSGLDSRPWRLPMPAHVAWYEVDWPDCISGKHARLADIGAATSHSEAAAKYPLKPASWAGVATDLAQPGFIGDLEAAGFSRALPSVFLCEGLLYYLQPGQVDSLLQAGSAAWQSP